MPQWKQGVVPIAASVAAFMVASVVAFMVASVVASVDVPGYA
jgi:hypothetical protein